MTTDFNDSWLDTLDEVLKHGAMVAPRGKLTRELPQRTIAVNMQSPVLSVSRRQLHYKFMAAEAYWILSGDDTVAGIAPYNKRIEAFSDDGEKFFGAYGPKIVEQMPYIIKKLNIDPMSRQAGLTIWRESPPETKDVPCTIAIFFSARGANKLNCHVFMRSSDIWLGLPYDVFNFSMLTHLVCGSLNRTRKPDYLEPGTLYLTAASSHLYEANWDEAVACLLGSPEPETPQTPMELWTEPKILMDRLKALRETKPGNPLRWWES